MENDTRGAHEAQRKAQTLREMQELAKTGDIEQVQSTFDYLRKQGTPLWELASMFAPRWGELAKPGQHYRYAGRYDEPRINGVRARDTFVGAIVLSTGRFAVYSVDCEWDAWDEEQAEGEEVEYDYDRDFDADHPDFARYNFHGVLPDPKTKPRERGYYDYGDFIPLSVDEAEFLFKMAMAVKEPEEESVVPEDFDQKGMRNLTEAFGFHVSSGLTNLLPDEVVTEEYLRDVNRMLGDDKLFDEE